MKNKLFLVLSGAMIALCIAGSAMSAGKNANRSELFETYIGDAVTDAMRDAAGADVAMINAGSLGYENLPARITKETVSDIVPFGGDEVVTIEMTGADIIAALEKSYSLLPRSSASFLQVSGLQVAVDLNMPVGKRIKQVTIGGTSLKRSGVYLVATTDYLASGGGGLSSFRNGEKTDMKPIALESALLDYMDFDLKKINTTQSRIIVLLPDEE